MTQAPAADVDRAAAPTAAAEPTVQAQTAEFPPAADTGARVPGGQMDILLDTTVEITVLLGDAQLPAREVLQLGPGAVITLNRQAGEPVDLILNGVRFATGNIVVVGDQLGIRVREIFGPRAADPQPPAD